MEEKLNELIDAIKENSSFKRYKELKKEIETNEKYLKLIKKYQENPLLETKKEVFSIPLLKEFYKLENEIDLMLLEINNILKLK